MQTIFLTKIGKIGTSHGVVIPKEVLSAYHWERGDTLVFGFHAAGQLWLKKVPPEELEKLKPPMDTIQY